MVIFGRESITRQDRTVSLRSAGTEPGLPGTSGAVDRSVHSVRRSRGNTQAPSLLRGPEVRLQFAGPLSSRGRPSRLQAKQQPLGPPHGPYREGWAATPPRTLPPDCAVGSGLSFRFRTAQYILETQTSRTGVRSNWRNCQPEPQRRPGGAAARSPPGLAQVAPEKSSLQDPGAWAYASGPWGFRRLCVGPDINRRAATLPPLPDPAPTLIQVKGPFVGRGGGRLDPEPV